MYAPLWKRLMASIYDLLPLIALLMLGTALMLLVTGAEGVPQTGVERIPLNDIEGIPRSGPAHYAYQAFMMLLVAIYYTWSWHRGGQTIGMRAWRLRVQTEAGEKPGLKTATLRFLLSLVSIAALGLGLLWALFDQRKRMWHDRWSGTEVVYVPKS
jgi:uncharacterized RDD family membrane protein YckC